jgi:hypothetical protein
LGSAGWLVEDGKRQKWNRLQGGRETPVVSGKGCARMRGCEDARPDFREVVIISIYVCRFDLLLSG